MPPPHIVSATGSYRKAEDLIEQFFEECCVIKEGAFCRGGEIFEAHEAWCNERGAKSKRMKFYEKLSALFPSKKTDTGKIYRGIGLLTPSDGE